MKVNIIKTSTVSSKMDEFVIENEVLYECNLTGTVVVPENVTKIKATAFSNKTNIIKVVLPEGLKTIGTIHSLDAQALRKLSFLKVWKLLRIRHSSDVRNSRRFICQKILSVFVLKLLQIQDWNQ